MSDCSQTAQLNDPRLCCRLLPPSVCQIPPHEDCGSVGIQHIHIIACQNVGATHPAIQLLVHGNAVTLACYVKLERAVHEVQVLRQCVQTQLCWSAGKMMMAFMTRRHAARIRHGMEDSFMKDANYGCAQHPRLS